MKTVFFKDQSEFRKWLEKNHNKETELFVGYYKVKTGKPSMTWSQSVDEALCYGWIDGIRRTIDEESYNIRFTPRRPISNWSAVNIKKVEELTIKGLMQPAGLEIYKCRKEGKSGIYTHENKAPKLSIEYEHMFRANEKAWVFFQSQPPSYHKQVINWVMSAKLEANRQKRLNELISDSNKGLRIKQLRR
jgi:uncharacterized protein YdeI (YjbR/CyaY-like superfamily)